MLHVGIELDKINLKGTCVEKSHDFNERFSNFVRYIRVKH